MNVMRLCLKRAVWTALILAPSFAGPCSAQNGVIFYNIVGNCSSFSTSCETEDIRGSASSPQSIAGQFTPATAVMAVDARVVVNLISQSGSDPSFNVALFSDVGGLPGAQIGQPVAGLMAPAYPGATVTASFSQSIPLQAGTPYWLVLTPADASSDVGWITGGSPSVPEAYSNSTGGSGWYSGGSSGIQFAIDGTAQPSPPVITTTSLPSGTVNVAYSQTLAATGGTPPYRNWTVASGSLPPGLTLGATNGIIGGTPTTANGSPFGFTVTVQDSAGNTSVAQALSINVAAGLFITTSSLSSDSVGVAYSQTLAATGGWPPYSSWTIISGSLPAGLSLNSATGVISGAPTTAGTSSFSLTVKDSIGNTSPAQALSIAIVTSVGITTSSLPSGSVGVTYSQQLAAAGGIPPYRSWALTSGSLPPGLTLNAANGLISGTPTTAVGSPFAFKATVQDSAGNTSPSQSLLIAIVAPPTITSLSPSSAFAGGPAFTLTVNGSGFVSGSTVDWINQTLETTYVSASQLTAAVPAALIATAGSVAVTVVNPSGSTSNSENFPINPPSQAFPVPAILSFTYGGGNPPAAQTFSVFSSAAPVNYSLNVSYAANGPTNWLKITPATGQTPGTVTVTPQNLPSCAGPTACSYTATINVTTSNAGVAPAAVAVTLSVVPQTPQLTVAPEYVTVSSFSGAAPSQQQVQVFNIGGGTLNYTVATPIASWLTISCGISGSVAASASTPVCLTLNPGSLQQGNYHALLTINAGNQSAAVNVTLQVAAADPLILLSPNAMQFTAVSGGATPSPQSLSVFNIGTGTLDWTAQATSTHNWLQVSTANGCAGASQTATGSATSGGPPSTLTVCVGLAEAAVGENFGQIAVSSESSANSEAITVLLNVLPGGSALPELASPTGVTLQTTAGSTTLPSSVTLSNPNNTPVSFNAIAVALSGASSWLVVAPTNGSVPASGSTTIEVQGAATSLTTGTYDGQVRIGFGDGSSQVVNVIFNVNPASGQARRERRRDVLPDCPGGYVLPPQFVNLTQSGFQVPAGDVQLLQVTVKDSCGNAITPGDEGATLSVVIYDTANEGTLETPNLLYNSTDQNWEHSWTPTAVEVGPVGMYAIAGVGTGDNSIGNRSDIWTGSVTAAGAGSGAEPTAVLNAASENLDDILELNQVAAGSYISIYGTLLADGQATTYPFPTQEEGSTVELGGVPLRLSYVSPTQVNALVPLQANLPMNAPLPLKIQRDGTWSVNDLQVSVTNVQPGIYVLNPVSGQGAALIANTTEIVAPVGTYAGSRPAQAGVDYIEIYCNGLGPVTNAPADGQPAPGNPLAATTTLPQVTIGGVQVPAYWAGLSPGSVALYQVDVQVPAGSQTGDAVPLMIQMGGTVSNTVNIAVQ